MKVPVEVMFHGIDHSDSVEARIRGKIDHLEQLHGRFISCRVTVEKHPRHRGELCVNIIARMPGKELVVRREPRGDRPHENYETTIDDAFSILARRLSDTVSRRLERAKATTPEDVAIGTITKLFEDDGYGFLAGPDGSEVYFHRNSVVNEDFDQLVTGLRVEYTEEAGEKGPQAARVQVLS